jgi:adenylate kinase
MAAPAIERKEVDKSKLKGIPIVWIMGGPGCGRGTQCEMIHGKFDFVQISSGELLRREVMSGSKRGGQLYKLMSSGMSVPNEIVNDLLAEGMVHKADKAKGFLIDGYPQDQEQAAAFEKDIGVPVLIIYLEASNEVLSERLSSRNNFDDNFASINKRIATFNTNTLPVIEKYGDKIKRINVERTKEEIFADVEKIFSAM